MHLFNRILLTGFFALALGFSAQAQMPAAKPIKPKVNEQVVLNASADAIWEYVSSPMTFYSDMDIVEQLSGSSNEVGAKMSFKLPGDTKRKQEVTFIDDEKHIIAYYITQSDYFNQPFVYRLIVASDKNESQVRFEGIYGTDNAKAAQELKVAIEKEWAMMKDMLTEKFN